MPLFFWFDYSLDDMAEICQFFCCFFGKFKTPKFHSEIIWPLEDLTEMRIPSDINPPFKVVEVKAKSDGQKYALKILKDSAKSR